MIVIDEDKCTGCGDCLEVCPQEGAIVLQEARAVISQDRCTNCAACLAACSEGAIYEMEAALIMAGQTQPAQATKQSTLSRARPAIVSTLAAAAPLAVDALAGLAGRWLDERSLARTANDRPGPAPGGRQRRRRRGRRW
jgi:NAD-dependent dihydropyrimidine dehydrogenase PreA subunit